MTFLRRLVARFIDAFRTIPVRPRPRSRQFYAFTATRDEIEERIRRLRL